jgi:sigma-B regulation protein RsbU (phosphoserine phosphatase)
VKPRVLVCDDQADVRIALEFLLKGAGLEAVLTDGPAAALELAAHGAMDLILTDMNFTRDTTSGAEGLALVNQLSRLPVSPRPPVVVMTAWGDVDLAVSAMRLGAVDFVQKPWDNARLLDTLNRALNNARAAQSELDIARNVQRKLLPPAQWIHPRARLTTRFEPAREVGGDFYDYALLPGERLAFLLADVSGKGVPAAMLMANLQASFRARDPLLMARPLELVRVLHDLFRASTEPSHYATLFYGCLDLSTGELRYVNCGHPSDAYPPSARPLGLLPDLAAEERLLVLAPGDCLYLCSDGVLEADLVEDDRTELTLEYLPA